MVVVFDFGSLEKCESEDDFDIQGQRDRVRIQNQPMNESI